MTIAGIGVDVVDIGRFERALAKAPRLVERLFEEAEQQLPAESLAARFAAKEAVAKALRGPSKFRWRDCIVHKTTTGKPELELTGSVAEAAKASGIDRWHISLTHDGGLAMAFVVAEQLAL